MLSFGGEQGMREGYGSVRRVRGARRMTDTGFPSTTVAQKGLHLALKMFKHVAELTLAPSGDEILPVRSQEPTNQCLSCEKKISQNF